MYLASFWAIFFTNSSGRPVTEEWKTLYMPVVEELHLVPMYICTYIFGNGMYVKTKMKSPLYLGWKPVKNIFSVFAKKKPFSFAFRLKRRSVKYRMT
jgi:hypothetical protein